ncbi:hypothetical protein COU18_02200 [Candidatus Kaiserbacteria bacterium CG10_big_fil_rev_8_21_14_0_10_51_14]|uniref:Uncharacterized protein n=1 Tax=Candidatus Kaiserbacteria bacterium CG10_big_fil_rev_8_21_14_0_10_51_14 TaxID=1974610 RepID=A0A2H0UBS2_9BACT|nr:MAG: hypothetical protein COU18_02200 [Candidatus Kaiserbacteria bacterium CG10_big_fil_rev_8_21_14_0_10_51_14]
MDLFYLEVWDLPLHVLHGAVVEQRAELTVPEMGLSGGIVILDVTGDMEVEVEVEVGGGAEVVHQPVPIQPFAPPNTVTNRTTLLPESVCLSEALLRKVKHFLVYPEVFT